MIFLDSNITLELHSTSCYYTQMTSVIEKSPDKMGGTAVFSGTRVPIETLLDYLRGGDTIEDFLEGFPTVKREQVLSLLEEINSNIDKIAA